MEASGSSFCLIAAIYVSIGVADEEILYIFNVQVMDYCILLRIFASIKIIYIS
jgi:hypothetical protein